MEHPEIKIHSASCDETVSVSSFLAALLGRNDIVALDGDLGAGKTVFVSGLAKGLGIDSAIPSPTFTILIEYRDSAIPLFHFDAYRLSGAEEFRLLGFEEYLHAGGVCVMEWAQRVHEVFPIRTIHVDIRKDFSDESGSSRWIRLRFPPGDHRFEKFSRYYSGEGSV